MPRVSTVTLAGSIRSRLVLADFPAKEMGWLWQSCVDKGVIQKKKKKIHPNGISHWARLCNWRLQGVPLQYLIGWQPFGSLKILCRNHVLIPRWETEEWVNDLGQSILTCSKLGSIKSNLNLVDFCTGTGCIPLLLLKMTRHTNIFKQICAFDISPDALKLTQRNVVHNHLEHSTNFKVQYANILNGDNLFPEKIDMLTCNPPYISKNTFESDVEDSVKRYEPHLALVGDLEFYENLIQIWLPHINSFVYELGSYKQFNYVKEEIIKHNNNFPNNKFGLGMKFDSNGQIRCVFGFNEKIKSIFQNYGQLIIQI
ncbi:mitochondrial MRF1 N(5)-glutamine methyltransferase Mtq1p [Monosporozyma unispora]